MNNPASPANAPPRRAIDIVNASLKRRYAAERRFRALGVTAVFLGLSFVLLLFVSIVGQCYTAFQQTYIKLPIVFDPGVIDPDGAIRSDTLNEREIQRRLSSVNFAALTRAALQEQFPDVSGRADTRVLNGLLSVGAPMQLRDLVAADPTLIGTRRKIWLLADDDVDMFMKGRATPLRTIAPSGTITPTNTVGDIVLESTADDFAPLLASVRAFLEHRIERTQRDIDRIQRSYDEAAEELRHAGEALAQASAAGDVAATVRLQELEARHADLTSQLAEKREKLASFQARLDHGDGAEELTADMPSYLLQINGGMVKVTAVSGTRIDGTVYVPLKRADPAAAADWRILELSLPESDRRFKDRQIAWVQHLKQQGRAAKRFNTIFFTNGTSREPELAGIAGALMGSFYTLLLTLLFSFPIGVGAAVYLEEFAPKNRLTDLIEVNINNLAAVPSIVFGLLGLAVFINFFGVPRSTPWVAALVLTLMTLPTIIIASRAALKSVPPSIREAALGVGASPLQTQLHHVLPLAMPGMLTGTIIGMAQALGETAPLLMIGMIAFIVDIPGGFNDPATVLPVQIYLWADSPERAFVERTSAAIMVLLAFLIMMNLAAVLLRRRFERRW